MKNRSAYHLNYHDIETIFQKNNVRLTHQRIEIYKQLRQSDQHPSAEDIYRYLHKKMPTLSLDTIYRNLQTFEIKGLIKRVSSTDDRARYDANLTPHHHLCCRFCKKIEDLPWEIVGEFNIPDSFYNWTKIHTVQVIFEGVCKNCSNESVYQN